MKHESYENPDDTYSMRESCHISKTLVKTMLDEIFQKGFKTVLKNKSEKTHIFMKAGTLQTIEGTVSSGLNLIIQTIKIDLELLKTAFLLVYFLRTKSVVKLEK